MLFWTYGVKIGICYIHCGATIRSRVSVHDISWDEPKMNSHG